MKKHKRDTSSRAFDRGYRAGVSGRSVDFCPHAQEEQRQHWVSGWREGRVDQWDGLTGISGVHKMRVS
ncbi:ribosome modulation factor [Kineobactrum sediminis]|uniref:Ribosome modulation factor n=1 Tax=Kineobactrum sediminis TaxID=1905677 RepID=A0A2N5Y2L5_9GAMM|nr:ribosome modulation factor [Kineobactrum sediminis]PLW82641.1 ribosome modulation factor [Kineobactrum sediminis]